MANIRINALPSTTSVLADSVLPMDGLATQKIKPLDMVNAVRPFASQAEAEAGVVADKDMSPLTTRQAIDGRLPSSTAGRALLAAADDAAQRGLLGLGAAARLNVGSSAGTVAAGDDIRFAGVAGIVDQATAEAGANNTGIMSPLRTKQAVTVQATLQAEDRAALALLPAKAFCAVINNEVGRNGLFVWNSGNLSAIVTVDPAQGIYVPPATDATGASGAWVRVFDGDIYAKWFGAVGDGVTDDRAAIQAALDLASALGAGRNVVLTDRHLIDTSISVPENVGVIGPKGLIGHIDGAHLLSQRPSIVLNSAATITLANASHVRNLLIYRKGLTIPCTAALVALFAGKAITLVNGTADMLLENLMILGFEYAVYTDPSTSNTSRLRVERLNIDCTNGIYNKNSFDVSYYREIHCWPFCSATAPAEANDAQNRRTGAALYLEGRNDWTEVNNFFSFGYARGIRLNGVDNVVVIGGAADNPPASASYLDGYIGMLIEGDSNEVTVIGHRVAAKQYGFWVNVANDGRHDIQFIGCRALACVTQGFRVEQGRTHILGGGANGLGVATSGAGVGVNATAEECRIIGMSFVDLAFGIDNASTTTRTFFSECNFTAVTTKFSNPYVLQQASADPMVLDGETLRLWVTGTTNFGTLNNTADYAGKMVTLMFTGALTVNSGGNMALAGGANFNTSANDTLTLLSNGTSWLEIARSANP